MCHPSNHDTPTTNQKLQQQIAAAQPTPQPQPGPSSFTHDMRNGGNGVQTYQPEPAALLPYASYLQDFQFHTPRNLPTDSNAIQLAAKAQAQVIAHAHAQAQLARARAHAHNLQVQAQVAAQAAIANSTLTP